MILEQINKVVWGIPALLLIFGTGIYLTLKTGFFQLRMLPTSLLTFFSSFRSSDDNRNSVSSFQALCTALAATVGTGNIAGVAGAIILGGPGAIFWMWISAVLGMVIKFAEAALCVRYRKSAGDRSYYGGPMYMITEGLDSKWHFLAWLYAFFGVIAAFGVGNATQINACLTGLDQAAQYMGLNLNAKISLPVTGVIALLIAVILLGGAARIGKISQCLVPFASAGYLLLCIGVLAVRRECLANAFCSILHGAFSPEAFTGGVVCSLFMTVRIGVSRGVFTNEAGMGTAGIAHAGASVAHPVEQGLMGIVEVFLDTVVICTMTALVILCSGVPIPYGQDVGAALTNQAFASVFGDWIAVPMALFLFSFAFATMIGWGLYGIRCAQFLFGMRAGRIFIGLQCAVSLLSACLKTGTVWLLADIVNGLMSIPNLLAILMLTPALITQINDYIMNMGRLPVHGGTYEDFNQRQPLRAVSYAEISSSGRCCRKKRQEDL